MSAPSEPTPFGAPMLSHFQFDPAFKNLNHGSFGTHPIQTTKALQKYQHLAESRPDPFIRYEQPVLLNKARTAIAHYLNAPVADCVFVKNATSGVNTVLRNLVFQPGDAIVYFDTVYGAVEKTITSLEETRPVRGVKVEYSFPITHAQMVDRFVAGVKNAKEKQGLNVRVAVFETVASVPGIRLPFEELVRACRDLGVLSLIDGAHAVGMIPLDLGGLRPDFFTSNCHKWLYTPRSSAILYVAPQNQHLIRTTHPTSWGFVPLSAPEAGAAALTGQPNTGKTRFETLFEFVATSDDSPYLCVPEALEFRERVCGGEENVYAYLDKLALEGGDVVAEILDTEVLQENGVTGQDSRFRRCSMVNVRLPLKLKVTKEGEGDGLSEEEIQSVMRWLGETFVREYGTFVPVFRYGGALWTRLSAQVYLEKKDFEWLGGVLLEVCKRVMRREFSS